MGHVAGHAAAALNGALVALGDQLGLWTAMAGAGPLTVDQLAERAQVDRRYLREWLAAQAANGMVVHRRDADLPADPTAETFELTGAATAVLAAPDGPASLIAGFAMLPLLHRLLPALGAAFRTGDGVGWLEWDNELHDAEERFSRPFHLNFLVDVWLAGVPGLLDALVAGAKVADVGCGYGTSTILLAQRFPASTFVGYDFHDHSVARAREAARRAGVSDRVRFEVADAADLPGTDHDLVLFCDSLHDMGDPVGVARHARRGLAPGGRLVTLDPAVTGSSLAEHLADPFAALLYPVSTFICTPAALAQHGPRALGALAGEVGLRQVLSDAGFSRIDRVPDTPVNMVLYTTDERAGAADGDGEGGA